ncbi:hypothetical protein Efla_001116 [Eimeria flavescens]
MGWRKKEGRSSDWSSSSVARRARPALGVPGTQKASRRRQEGEVEERAAEQCAEVSRRGEDAQDALAEAAAMRRVRAIAVEEGTAELGAKYMLDRQLADRLGRVHSEGVGAQSPALSTYPARFAYPGGDTRQHRTLFLLNAPFQKQQQQQQIERLSPRVMLAGTAHRPAN